MAQQTSPAVGEVPTSTDGINWTLGHTPTDPTRVEVYLEGPRQTQGTHYTIAGRVITFLAGFIPPTGAAPLCDYPWDDGVPTGGDLTSLANVKLWLNISDTSADAILARLITTESAWFVQQIGRNIIAQSYVETIDGNDDRVRRNASLTPWLAGAFPGVGAGPSSRGWALDLENWPVISITSVLIDGDPVPQGSNPGQDTQVDGWLLVSTYRLELLGPTYSFDQGIQNIVITYEGGYASVPAEIDQAICELVAYRFRERDRIGQRAKTVDGQPVTFMVDGVPPSVQSVIDQYRRVQVS